MRRWAASAVRVFGGKFVNRKFAIGGLAAACVMLSACATITRGSTQKYSIETSPTQAEVKLSTGQTCVSPCNLKLKRKAGFTVKASKQGYSEATAIVDSHIRGGGIAGGAGNILAGGLIGIAVDASSGAMNDLTPNPLLLTLQPLPVAAVTEAAPATPVEAAPADAASAVDPVAPTTPTENSASVEAEQPAPGL